MGEEGADILPVGLSLILQRGDGFLQTSDVLLSRCSVLLCLLRIGDEDETPTALAVADYHLFHLEVVLDDLVPSLPGEHLSMNRLVIPEFLAEDVVTTGGLEDAPVLLGVHASVGDPDTAGELPARKVLLDRLDGLYILGIPGKHPRAHRDTFFRDRQTDHYLGQVGPAIL